MIAVALRLPAALPSLTLSRFKTYSLAAALVIYALAGTPTPDSPGIVEAVIGALLVTAVGVRGAYYALKPPENAEFWHKIGAFLLVFGLVFPVVGAILSGNDIFFLIRDVISFIFLLFPVFLAFLGQCEGENNRIFIFLSAFIGISFAARALLRFWDDGIFGALATGELHYFANLPTVLFSALFLTGAGVCMMGGIGQRRRVLAGAGLLVLALLPYGAMAVNLQRATMGAACLYLAAICLYAFVRAPYRAFVPLAFIAAITFALAPFLGELRLALEAKSAAVGLNMRWQEAQAVWAAVSESPFSLVFGLGWGAGFHSPAVAGLSVNFTHSLITAMLLKTGLCGLFLTLLYLGALGRELLRLVLNKPVLGLAFAAPVLINVLLYASYKSLDFGIVLLLIPLSVHVMQTQASRKS